jgi:predicted nucleic acid-binding protein
MDGSTRKAAQAIGWLLDTDVICQPAKKNGDARVVAWLEAEQDRCYTSAVVIAQLAYWVRTKDGRQRQALQAWLTRLVDALHGRIHGFNVSVAHVWAEQERLLDKTGQGSRQLAGPVGIPVRMPVEDSYIAATARRHGLTIATGHDRDFKRPGLRVFNPFKELPWTTVEVATGRQARRAGSRPARR